MKKVVFLLLFYFSLDAFSQRSVRYQPPAFADTTRLQKVKATQAVVEKLYKEYADRFHFPALVFGVVGDGQLLYTGSTGYTDVAKKIPATTTSAFRIASMTKSFTALAILQLRDAGKLHLDDPVYTYIPEMKKLHYLTTDAPPITVRHLMTHAAGFPEDNPWGDRQLADTDKELLQLIENDPFFSNVPGITYEYSNLGFALLGKIVTNVSGKPYQQFIAENIFKPLGMNHTYWEYTKVPATQLAHGYRWQNEQWMEESLLHDGAYGAMGGLITSIEDFAKYMALHMAAWPPRNGAESVVLKRSSLREMHQPWNFNFLNTQYHNPDGRPCAIATSYSCGLRWTKDCDGITYIDHSGGLPGFGSQWRFLPEYGIGVLCFANRTYAPISVINAKVLDTILKLSQLKPRALPPSAILQKRKEELIKILPDWKGAENSRLFAENFFLDNPIDSLRKQATSLFTKAGKIVQVHEIVPQNQLRGAFVMEGEKKNIEIFFTLTPENPPLIQQLNMREVPKF
ncbi:MAG: beta-lactamase family protein [Flavisolibacter sp.]|nr:beta-lactamase family protein [Flavisolibacter sp.]